MPGSSFDTTVTRLPNGIGTRSIDDIFSDLKYPDPTRYHQFFDDFDRYAAADWTVTETDSGATEALTDGDGGLLLITNTAADNDLVSLQKVGESFKFAAGKKLFFKTRFKVSNATQSDIVIGLCITDTTPLDVTDGMFFIKPDDDVVVNFYSEKNNTQTGATSIASMADDTFIELAFFWDGVSKCYYAVDGTVKGSITPGSNLCDDEDLTVTISLQNGSAAARTLTVDYVFVAKER